MCCSDHATYEKVYSEKLQKGPINPRLTKDYIFDLSDDMLGDLHIFSKKVAKAIEKAKVPLIFFGGSLLTRFVLEEKLGYIKKRTTAKIVLFPGSVQQVSPQADAILFLSLISVRNQDFLIVHKNF